MVSRLIVALSRLKLVLALPVPTKLIPAVPPDPPEPGLVTVLFETFAFVTVPASDWMSSPAAKPLLSTLFVTVRVPMMLFPFSVWAPVKLLELNAM